MRFILLNGWLTCERGPWVIYSLAEISPNAPEAFTSLLIPFINKKHKLPPQPSAQRSSRGCTSSTGATTSLQQGPRPRPTAPALAVPTSRALERCGAPADSPGGQKAACRSASCRARSPRLAPLCRGANGEGWRSEEPSASTGAPRLRRLRNGVLKWLVYL